MQLGVSRATLNPARRHRCPTERDLEQQRHRLLDNGILDAYPPLLLALAGPDWPGPAKVESGRVTFGSTPAVGAPDEERAGPSDRAGSHHLVKAVSRDPLKVGQVLDMG